MALSPKDELAEFLEPLPIYQQKVLWYTPSMSQQEVLDWMHSVNPFSEAQILEIQAKTNWSPPVKPFDENVLRQKFENILQRIPHKWNEYRKNAKAWREKQAELMFPMPHGKSGRKRNDDLAERVQALKLSGMSTREIQSILRSSGVNLSLSGVESYLKRRRRPPGTHA